MNDEEVVKYNSHGRFPQTKKKLLEYVNLVKHSMNIIVLAIIDIKSEKHIGNISLQSINWIDRNAEIAFVLGEKNFWSKGFHYNTTFNIAVTSIFNNEAGIKNFQARL